MANDAVDVVLDADVLMNLVASGHASEVAGALSCHALLCPRPRAEALYLRLESGGQEEISLGPMLRDGTLVPAEMSPDEIEMYVELASVIDDGEAQALAVAAVRNLRLVTDDRKARREAGARKVVILSTPELMRNWADVTKANDNRLATALRNIETRASYRPSAQHPLREWWDKCLQRT